MGSLTLTRPAYPLPQGERQTRGIRPAPSKAGHVAPYLSLVGEDRKSPRAEGDWLDGLGEGFSDDAYPSAQPYSFISISRNVKPKPDSANALLGSLSAGTDTRFEAAKTAVWSSA